MMVLDDIRNNLAITNQIDWAMTPEEAVTLYLEWGNNWTHGKLVKSKDDVSYYFVIYAWDEQPKVIFIRRNSEEAVDLASINIPEDLGNRFMESIGFHKGVYALSEEVKSWLKKELAVS